MNYRAWIMDGVVFLLFGLITLWVYHETHLSQEDSFSPGPLFTSDVSKPTDTQLVAHPDVPLDPTKNVLWCGTMQLAWNKAVDLVGENLRFINQPPVVDLLNRKDFTDADLDSDSYVALADFEKNNVEDEIRAALEKTFQGAASPELVPEKPADAGPDDFVAYAYLYKNLRFPSKFKVLASLAFGGHKVEAFGFNEDENDENIFKQVGIIYYKSENDFIIKLKTKSPDDELILAKITPDSTFAGTITRVLNALEPPDHTTVSIYLTGEGDQLSIPKLNFHLSCDFLDLENLILEPSAEAHIHPNPPLIVKQAKQVVCFQLNERGSILKSEAAYIGATLGGGSPPSHAMIFDKPFLILMKRTNSNHAYFALWVGNTSLLVPASSSLF